MADYQANGAAGDGEKKNAKRAWNWKALARRAPLLPVLAAIVLAIVYRDRISVDTIVNAAPESQALTALVLLGLFALKSITVVFYMKAIYVAAGLLLPMPLALAVNVLGTAIDFTIPYWIGRCSGADMADKLLKNHPKLAHIHEIRAKNDFLFALLIRAIAIISADPLSMYLGATRMPFAPFLFGGLCGMVPAIILATVLGDAVRIPGSPQFWWAVGIYAVVLLGAGLAFWLWKRKNERGGAAPQAK